MSSGRSIAYQLLSAALIILVLEAAARLAFTIYAGPLYANTGGKVAWFTYVADLGWAPRPGFDGPDDCGAHRRFDSQGLLVEDADQLKNLAPGQRKVIFLGDSNTYGYCLKTERTFVEVADRLLPQFSLINLAVPGYTTYQGYKTLQKYGEIIHPDITIISFNANDRRYVLSDADVDSDAKFEKPASPKGRLLEHSYLFRAVRALGTKIGIVRPGGQDPIEAVELTSLRPRVDLPSYRSNLIKMVQWARQHGSAVYFIILGDNPSLVYSLRKGIKDLEQHDDASAINSFKLVTDQSSNPFASLARIYLSMALREVGDTAQAERVLSIVPTYSAHGGYPILQDTDYNDIMRAVAEEYGVPVIDAKSELDKTPRVFYDICHFDAEGHEIVGELLKNALMNIM